MATWAFIRMRLLLVLLTMTTIAHADAREDIVDIRHRRMPNRTAVLGWTAEGAFVLRRTSCIVQDLSDSPSCAVTIDVASRDRTVSHLLFNATWEIDCVEKEMPAAALGCYKIPTADAMKFIAAERELLASLGSLRAGTPSLASGTVKAIRYDDDAADRRRAALVLSSGGRWRPLHVLWSVETGKDEFLRSDPAIEHIERSPDRTSLAIVTMLSHAEDDFYWETFDLTVVPAP